jgi:hypothetical protein
MSFWYPILIAAFSLHGLAHLSGFLAGWTNRNVGFSPKPWLFSHTTLLKGWVGRLFGVLWLIAAAALVGSGLDLFLRAGWWPALPIAGAMLSLLVILPWWNTVPPGARAGAVFDLLVLAALLPPWRAGLLQALQT